MKVEMGESLVTSWLKHSKHCQLVQGNWKASTKTWKLHNFEIISDIIDTCQLKYLKDKDIDLFKKSSSVKQILLQGEIDVLGISVASNKIEELYAVDVAFHEKGFNYGSKDEAISRVLKKIIRMACTVIGYFDIDKAKIIFATPKMSVITEERLKSEIQFLNNYLNETWDLNLRFQLIANDNFKREIFDKVNSLSSDVADTSELYMRSIQMYNLFNKKK